MLLRTVVIAASLSGFACIDDREGPPDAPDERDVAQVVTNAQVGPEEFADVCDVLPPEGPCSCACDHQALADRFVPPGTCATFQCELTDGREVIISACHPVD